MGKLADSLHPRTVGSWALVHGLPRLVLTSAARRGDLVAGTAIDPTMRLDPFATYDQIRAQGRIVSSRLISATAHHDVANEILRSDSFGVVADSDFGPPWLRRLLHAVSEPDTPGPVDPPSLLAVDGEQHTRYRKLVSRVFTPRAVDGLRPRIAEVAGELLDALPPDRPFDLVEQYAKLLPLIMISEILGVPEDLRDEVREMADAGALLLDPGLPFGQYRDARVAVRAAHARLGEHVGELRRNPGPDLLSRLATLQGADRLTDLELRATALLLIGAGFETTVNLISNAVSVLLAHPEQLAALRAGDASWDNAVEEVLRFDSPVQVTLRNSLRGSTVGGVSVPAGRPVLVILAAANRDPAVFAEPHTFDVTRANAREHLSFSAGVHFCLGATLARNEAAIALQTLFERMPDLRIAGRPRRRGTRVLRGYEELPVASSATARSTAR
jgi:cytochrome P450